MRTSLLLLAGSAAIAAEGGPLAFATWTGDPCTSLTVRVLDRDPAKELRFSGADGKELVLPASVRAIGATGWSVAEATANGLAAGSEWKVGVRPGETLARFRTLRAGPPLRFATGGDLLHRREWMAGTTARVAAASPSFALIGGDWAYDNGNQADFRRWIDLFAVWTAATTPDGMGIPLVAGIGNHELARHGQLAGTPFNALFPEPVHRAVDVGGWLSFLLLDSGHSEPVKSQTAWLDQALGARAERSWRFAMYHVPAYPSVRKFDDWGSNEIRAEWVPLFERHGVAACFENHDHALKRTHPLLGGQPAAGGVVYLGDGAWGVEPRQPGTPEQRPYLAKSQAVHHAWIIDLERDRGQARAIGADGSELDRVELSPRKATR